MTALPNEQSRFTTLRLRVLRGEATAAERDEVAAMLAAIEAQEAEYLQPATARLQRENAAKRVEIAIMHKQNQALEIALLEHEQAVADMEISLAVLTGVQKI